ncbi:hypothetical protein LPJ61_002726 [Coemansia biformis]|uniref:Sugar phosphate transporter domain-containing protein n=1 Tax=Coemansia biformis TaxID=1286918 RepID=A0A9W8CZC5_9FUNG|nr:hypothetical protein LPJ61_002726 [Coemansia biformis]
MAGGGTKAARGVLSITLYLLISLGLTLHNKMVLQWHQFGFPWLVTAVHALAGIIGMRLLEATGHFTPKYLDSRQRRLLWMFSVLYTVNIAVSNVSLHYVSVPLHQIVRGTVPVSTVLITLMFRGSWRGYSRRVYLSLVPVVLGAGMATYGDHYSFTLVGFLLTLLGTVLAALKTVVTNTILVGGYRLRLSALDLLYRLCPLAFAQTLIWAVVSGEATEAWRFVHSLRSSGGGLGAAGLDHGAQNAAGSGGRLAPLVVALVANGAIAFVLNVVSFTANKHTSALAMTVAGNLKVVLTVVLGCLLFDVSLSGLSIWGIVVTIIGSAAYSSVRLYETQEAGKQAKETA